MLLTFTGWYAVAQGGIAREEEWSWLVEAGDKAGSYDRGPLCEQLLDALCQARRSLSCLGCLPKQLLVLTELLLSGAVQSEVGGTVSGHDAAAQRAGSSAWAGGV